MIETAFVARYGDANPVVATMGEFDALSGLSQRAVAEGDPVEDGAAGHGCGQNLFGVGSFGGRSGFGTPSPAAMSRECATRRR